MMHKDLFSDGISRIHPDAVERLLQIERALERRAAGRRRKRIVAILAAAVLTVALLAASTLLLIPFIPQTYDLNYEIPKHQFASTVVRIYYTDANGNAQSELVKIPGDTEANVFLTWQHLNAVDKQVQLLNYEVTTEPMAGTTVVPDTLWQFLTQQLGKRDEQTIVTATLSAGITSYENQDALIDSLIQTIAKYAGVSPEQVRILIDGETIGIIGPLQFRHNLQGGGDVIIGTGSTLEITVGMNNISDQPIYYTGSSSAFVPDATLRLGNTVIEHEIYPHTEDEVALTLAPGESREVTYRFTIPADAPTGLYDLTVSFKGQSFTFTQAVQVVETTVLDILTIPNYTFIGLTFPESSGTLPQNIQTKILSAIQNSVCDGQAECDVGYIVFACNESETNSSVNYCGSHFHIYGYAWAPTGDDADFMDALVYALNAYKGANGYDTLLYYNGDFYGHSDAVDQAYQDKPMSGGGLSYKVSEDYVVAAKALYTPDFLYDKTFYVQNGYLWLDDGSYFEMVVNPSNNSGVTDPPFDSNTLFDDEMQYKPTYEDYLQIQVGMTVEEVVEILGKPHYRDSAVGSKYFCWETADGASCAIKVVSPHATEGWSDWADILQPHYGGATVVHCNYYGTVPDQDGK